MDPTSILNQLQQQQQQHQHNVGSAPNVSGSTSARDTLQRPPSDMGDAMAVPSDPHSASHDLHQARTHASQRAGMRATSITMDPVSERNAVLARSRSMPTSNSAHVPASAHSSEGSGAEHAPHVLPVSLCISTMPSVWTPQLYRSFDVDAEKRLLKGGVVVRLVHREYDALLTTVVHHDFGMSLAASHDLFRPFAKPQSFSIDQDVGLFLELSEDSPLRLSAYLAYAAFAPMGLTTEPAAGPSMESAAPPDSDAPAAAAERAASPTRGSARAGTSGTARNSSDVRHSRHGSMLPTLRPSGSLHQRSPTWADLTTIRGSAALNNGAFNLQPSGAGISTGDSGNIGAPTRTGPSAGVTRMPSSGSAALNAQEIRMMRHQTMAAHPSGPSFGFPLAGPGGVAAGGPTAPLARRGSSIFQSFADTMGVNARSTAAVASFVRPPSYIRPEDRRASKVHLDYV